MVCHLTWPSIAASTTHPVPYSRSSAVVVDAAAAAAVAIQCGHLAVACGKIS